MPQIFCLFAQLFPAGYDLNVMTFVCLLFSGLAYTFRRQIWLHFKVIAFFLGIIIGVVEQRLQSFKSFLDADFLTSFTPNSLQGLFLPLVVFADVFAMDSRAFLSTPKIAIITIIIGYGL